MGKWRRIGAVSGLCVLLSATVAWAALPPGGTFVDDDGNMFEGAIEAIAAKGITRGCNPPANTRYCPDDQVTRGQMAIFIVRGYNLPAATVDFFTDDTGKVYEDAADRLAQAGLTQGCAPNLYCGDDPMTRGEMAAFLARAENLPPSNTDHFVDDNRSIFEQGINKVADARITLGCNPPRNTNFCPNDNVTRGQMAAFLTRALDLTPIIPPPLTPSGPITVSNRSNLVVENLKISNPNGPCVRIVGSSNVVIRNSTIGPCGDWGVFIDRSSAITIQNTTVETSDSKGGIYGHSSRGVAVVDNKISNSGRNPVQFDSVTGSGNQIVGNVIASNASEDMISVFESSGTSASWLEVSGNTVKDNTGASDSGSGIMLGDGGGQYLLVQGNKLTNPGQAGIGVAGGSNIKVLNNTVTSARLPWSNVGIYVWNQSSGPCGGIEVRANSVTWLNSQGQSNPAYSGGGCGNIAGWGENSW